MTHNWLNIYISISLTVLSRIFVYRLLLGVAQQGSGGKFNNQMYLENCLIIYQIFYYRHYESSRKVCSTTIYNLRKEKMY